LPARRDVPENGCREKHDFALRPSEESLINTRIHHHFTVDVEEHFQVSALAPYVARADWDSLPSRVEASTRRILELMAERGARGTFFTLGWVAERRPDLVREIAAAGHEVASHGYGHERVTELTPEQFRESVRISKSILEDTIGAPVFGYRAPSFSIVRGSEWALDILIEEGYAYDSSLYPVRRHGYGFAGGERDPHRLTRPGGVLDELPPATLRVFGELLPAGGGAYLRLLPPALVSRALTSAERRGVPATFYIHPWEVDPGQPRFAVSRSTRIRHYGGLTRTAGLLRRLLGAFEFQPIAATLGLDAGGRTVRLSGD
jgi:polysaccharide deacetylase family protein (PEP-CTERM system associated)